MNPVAFIARVRWLAALLLLLALAGCKVPLYSNLNEQEANEIVAALSGEGIDAAKSKLEGTSWQVEVEQSRLGQALDVLRTQGLPAERYTTMGEVFQKQGLVSTPSEERMRYIYAVSQELSQTLRNVDGVVAARVHVVIPANDPLSEKIRPSSAAVFIKHRPDVDLRLLAPAVKDMVAHSIEGLTHDQVSLSLFEARRSAATPATNAGTQPQVLGLFSTQTAMLLLGLLFAAAVCLMVLPGLLRRQGLDWRSWSRSQVFRR
ncbi:MULTISPECIES: type III secretion inner membrane ring lipoprotein SctJ [unclassified Variovorax]|uniref:type III secretion system inner membrane ring lipoprotein SctJ n=1 Tax=unclassified Variovorax TaxID=663243 RepID=UPI00076BCBB6|nr:MULTISPECIES: type III secretion inner membrane ring lipoprotein SctJ [unclassified Variovorax]KWT98716.1 Type III secretion bridge between inner and outermembrane lipoprotein (YscJ,HrcJ,EscJ, PscJ) [Variovorax sp. WDL1]